MAKAQGTGLRGQPRRFAVVAAGSTQLAVLAEGRTYRVQCERLSNPADLEERHYVVAWTTGVQDEEEDMR